VEAEFRSGYGRRHLSCQAYTLGNSPERLAVARGDANRSVYQLMAQDRCYLHRHQIFRFAEVWPDEDLKMPILAALIIPALAYVPAAPAA
jgi:hypothetical protein